MKIRTDFVTNSSSSSFVNLHIDNPVLVGILAKYREQFEYAGFQFSGEENGVPTIIAFDDSESFRVEVPRTLQELTSNFIDNLPEDLDFDMDWDEFEALLDELKSTIKQKQKEINANYRKVHIESGEGGYDESTDFISEIIDGAAKRFGFRQMDESDPQFEEEVRKWKLILTYGDYDPNRRIDFYDDDIKAALRAGDKYAMARTYFSSAQLEFKSGDSKGLYTPGGVEKSGPDYDEYLRMLKAAGGSED